MGGVALQESGNSFRGALQQYRDVVVARGRRLAQQLAGSAFEHRCRGIAQPIECGAQWSAPRLLPAGMPAGIAAAIATPALNAMGAAPGSVVDDLHFVRRLEFFQELAVIGEPRQAVTF